MFGGLSRVLDPLGLEKGAAANFSECILSTKHEISFTFILLRWKQNFQRRLSHNLGTYSKTKTAWCKEGIIYFWVMQTERIKWQSANVNPCSAALEHFRFSKPTDVCPVLSSSSSLSRPALLIHLLPLASSVLPPSSPLPPLPPPQGFSGYHASLIQTSWGFFHRANYRQLGAQRITFSVPGKAQARGERLVLWNTQILRGERSACVCVVLGVCVLV